MTYSYYDEIKDLKTREARYEFAITDCYDYYEQLSGICMYAEECLEFPFKAKIKGCSDTIFEITGLASNCNVNTRVLCFAEANDIKTKVPLSEIIHVNSSKRNKMVIEDYQEWNNYF
ncbi:MAG: hypothetical protein A7316_03115 [Candidatus Altiarchaeales archaeon WOR_SM1_86-2]|nr:MAG: hypothetical protein A7316_03115 [Candidatus Altiarchaeales archaeon WOR_SM1_86-2]ODS41529.1 MAG: hypothetical protein A7315_05825 [Candidatus Altiarchaeales archaeon WOR_SM1_79]